MMSVSPTKQPLEFSPTIYPNEASLFHYAGVLVELKEGTAVPEPALLPNQPADDEVVDLF